VGFYAELEVKMSKESGKVPKIYIILGPTSSGKTSLALDLCEKFNGEIISADSRQVCKYMDIGTGKVPIGVKAEVKKSSEFWRLNGNKIWGYDLVEPDQYFSGYDFAVFALDKAREIIANGKNVFLVGGTGFYIDIFTGRVKPSQIPPNLELRKFLENLPLNVLQKKLEDIDPEVFKRIDRVNKVRLIRALEKNSSVDFGANNKQLPYFDFRPIYIGLTGSREVLYKRADSWVEGIWTLGLLDEVRDLRKKGFGEIPRIKGLIYGTAGDFLDGKVTKEYAIKRTKFNVHAYIRRQQTWFRRNPNIKWVDISQDDFEEIIYNKIKENVKNG